MEKNFRFLVFAQSVGVIMSKERIKLKALILYSKKKNKNL